MNPFAPTYFGPVTFVHHATTTNNGDNVTSPDSNSVYGHNIQSAYARDTVEITRWLQLIGGVRFDRFDMSATDQNTNTFRQRTDNLTSPQGAVILKPIDLYGLRFLSAGVRRPVQFVEHRDADPSAAEIREH